MTDGTKLYDKAQTLTFTFQQPLDAGQIAQATREIGDVVSANPDATFVFKFPAMTVTKTAAEFAEKPGSLSRILNDYTVKAQGADAAVAV